ncbi:hypothetical protein HDZ31DRAFT_60239 [Schizophyllum fasciatum]
MAESSDANAAFFAVFMRERSHLKHYYAQSPSAAGQPSRQPKASSHRRSTKDVVGKQAFLKDQYPRHAREGHVRRSPVVSHDEPSRRSQKAPRDDVARGRREDSAAAFRHVAGDAPSSWYSPAPSPPWVPADSLCARPTTPSRASSPQLPFLSPSGWSTDTDSESEVQSLDEWASDEVEVVEMPAAEFEDLFNQYINTDLCAAE